MSTTYLTIPKPEIHTGPKHQTVDEATIAYLREAAQRVRDNRYWGSGVTALVAKLLDDAASAIATASWRPSPGHTADPAAIRARLNAFLVAWRNRTGNDPDRIYNLDGGIEVDGGTTLLHSDIAALLAEVDDLRSRLACVAEAASMDRPYDTRIAAIRGMCDLTTNGLTPAALDGAHPTPSDGRE